MKIRRVVAEVAGRIMLPFFMAYYGRFWKLREACITCKCRILRKLLICSYRTFLDMKGASIPLDVVFKGEPCFPHGVYGVFISRKATIGSNVVIFQQVTIGSNTLNDRGNMLGSPHVGDNVYVGAGAKLIGNIELGENCRVGANCCVYKNVPPHSVVASSPMRCIQKHDLDNRFFMVGSNRYFDNGLWVEA